MMSKYIHKARRRELANATTQMTFDLEAQPGAFVPDVRAAGDRRQVLRTSHDYLMSLGRFPPGVHRPVTIINDIISSRRGKHDAANEHGLWTRYSILSHDLRDDKSRARGKKARLVCREYPDGINVVVRGVVAAVADNDPLTFSVIVERG